MLHGSELVRRGVFAFHVVNENQVAFSLGLKYNHTQARYLAIAIPIDLNSQAPRWGGILQLQAALPSAKKAPQAE